MISKINIFVLILLSTIICGCAAPTEIVRTEIVKIKLTATSPPPTSTFTSEPTNTPEPSATQTETPVPIPTLEGLSIPVPDLRVTNPELFDITNPNSPVYQFVNGIASSRLNIPTDDIVEKLSFQEFTEIDGNHFAVAGYKFDPDPTQVEEFLEGFIPLALFTEDTDWEEATIRNLSDKMHIQVGTTASFGDKDAQGNLYQSIIADEFSLVSYSSAFSNLVIDQYNNPHFWSKVAFDNNQIMKIKQMYWHHDFQHLFEGINNQDELISAVDEHFKSRSSRILSYIDKYGLRGKVIIELANEPFETLTWVPDHKSPIQKAYGKDWITEAYIHLYETAINEFDMVPGADFMIIGINERDIEIPGVQPEFVIGEFNKIKQDISDRLNVPEGDLPFDLGIEFHLGDKHGRRNSSLHLSYLTNDNRQYMIDHLQDISRRTNSRLHFTEVDAIGEEDAIASAYANLIEIAENSDVVDTIVFFHALASDRLDPNSDWQNPLFNENFTRGIVYYSLISRMLEMRN